MPGAIGVEADREDRALPGRPFRYLECKSGRIEPMDLKHRDKKAYSLAKEYLLGVPRVTSELLDKYLSLSASRPRPATIPGIYMRLLRSAQNAGMGTSVIGRAIGSVDRLKKLLGGFKPSFVLKKYSDWKQILDEIEDRLRPVGKIRRTSKSLWPRFCRTILSGAQFMSQFETADDFYRWVSIFDRGGSHVRPALPMLLAYEIDGIGFALACDFLKELGYLNYAKPDVHLTRLFVGLGLCPPRSNAYQVFKAIARVAEHGDVTPYAVDTLFWLIGSGKFYDDGLKIGRHGPKFIAYAHKRLAVRQRQS